MQYEYTEDELVKAKKIIEDNKITKLIINDIDNQVFYEIEGQNASYIVSLPFFCTCEQFIFRCLKEPKKVCKHILSVSLLKKYRKKKANSEYLLESLFKTQSPLNEELFFDLD